MSFIKKSMAEAVAARANIHGAIEANLAKVVVPARINTQNAHFANLPISIEDRNPIDQTIAPKHIHARTHLPDL